MTEREICSIYRKSKHPDRQIQILAELSGMDWITVVGILTKNNEKIPDIVINRIFKKLNRLEEQIKEKEKEYTRTVNAIKGAEE